MATSSALHEARAEEQIKLVSESMSSTGVACACLKTVFYIVDEAASASSPQGENTIRATSLFSVRSKYEEAIFRFENAAYHFKLARKWQDAGDAYSRCADCELKLKAQVGVLYRRGALFLLARN